MAKGKPNVFNDVIAPPLMVGFPSLPEHHKMRVVQEDSQKLGEFLNWLQEKHAQKCVDSLNIQKVLAEYFEINLDTIETEKRQMLAYQRMANARVEIFRELALPLE